MPVILSPSAKSFDNSDEEIKEVDDNDQEKAFIINEKPKNIIDKDLDDDSLVIFYIDAARFLPENTTVSRVSFRGIDEKANSVIPIEGTVCSLNESNWQSPNYNLRFEIYQGKLPPTTLILIQIETISKYSLHKKVAGYSFFPLFIEKDTQKPAVSNKSENYVANLGLFQMPVYWEPLKIVSAPVLFENTK